MQCWWKAVRIHLDEYRSVLRRYEQRRNPSGRVATSPPDLKLLAAEDDAFAVRWAVRKRATTGLRPNTAPIFGRRADATTETTLRKRKSTFIPPPCKPLCVSSPLHFSSISQFVFLSCANNTSRKRYYYFFLLLITLLNFNFDPSFSGREGTRRGGTALQKQNIFMAGFGDPELIGPEKSNADRLILYTAELFIVRNDQQLL